MKIAIITGASSGIGKEFAEKIAALKDTDELWLVARRADRLTELATALDPIFARAISLDLSENGSADELANMVKKSGAEVAYLVNAAGFGKFGDCFEVGEENACGMIDVNLRALVSLCYALLPYMKSGSRIINMSSISAYMPLENFSVYAATKAAVLSFSYSLRAELKRKNISVTAVAPGWVNTEFALVAHNGVGVRGPKSLKPMSEPDKVVDKALRDAFRSRPVSIYGPFWKLVHLSSKIFPRRFLQFIWRHLQKDT